MPGIIFSQSSGVADSIYGKSQAPVRMVIEKSGETFEEEAIYNKIFKVEDSEHYAEKITGLTAMNGFMPVGENGIPPEDETREGFSKTLEHLEWKDDFAISRRMAKDNNVLDLKQKPEAFIAGFGRTKESFAAALLGGATTGAKSVKFRGRTFDTTSSDNQGLFSKAHPSIIDPKKTQSNQFADAFSADALAALESKMQDFRGDNGEILDVVPDTIIIPNDYKLKKEVFAAIGADKDPASANNGFNFLFGRWNVIVWNYLNSYITPGSSPWILSSSKYNDLHLSAVWFNREPLDITSYIDHKTDANIWHGYSRFSAGFTDWRAFAVGGVAEGSALLN